MEFEKVDSLVSRARAHVDEVQERHPDARIEAAFAMKHPGFKLDDTDPAAHAAERLVGIPFLKGTLLSDDGKAVCLYLPITSKDLSYKIYARLKEKIATFEGDDQFFITGLPVAEDTFGGERFKHMAISAPIASTRSFAQPNPLVCISKSSAAVCVWIPIKRIVLF